MNGTELTPAAVAGLLTHRLLEVPRLDENEPLAWRSALADLCTAVVAAHAIGAGHAAPAVATCWVRARARGQTAMLCGGPAIVAPSTSDRDRDRVGILFPPGASGRALPEAQAVAALARFAAWVPCRGDFDPGWIPPESDEDRGRLSPGTREDCFALMAGHPLCWLVVATPVAEEAVEREMGDLALLQPAVADRSARVLDLRLRAERDEAWFRELHRARTAGLWELRVAAGALSGAVARQLAVLLASGRDLAALPFVLRPGPVCATLAAALGSPFPASAELVAALARPPLREVPGIRAVRRPTFDVTAESVGPVRLGHVMDETLAPCGEFRVGPETLNRHVFVCGATGAGKSQTVRTLLEQATAAGVRWLVVEPAKGEYRGMAARLGRGHPVAVIRPGAPDLPAVALNPLEPSWIRSSRTGAEVRFPLQTHLDLVKSLFVAAFESEEPFPQILSAALTRAYEDLGWNLALGESALTGRTTAGGRARPRYPRLSDLQRTARQVVEAAGYGTEVMNNVKGFVEVRLASLRLGSAGRFFEAGHALDLPALMTTDTVLELESIGDDQDKAFFIGTVLVRLTEHLRLQAADGETAFRHLTVVEEAHRLLRDAREGAAAHAVELFASILAEIRAYGEGVVVAEQIPTKILPDVVKNTALKVMHRLPAADDRATVGATMNLTEAQSEFVVSLEPGWAAAAAEGMDWPVLVRVDNAGQARESAVADDVLADPAVERTSLDGAPCGTACRRARPCTMRDLERARSTAEDARLILWAELTVVAHLTGDPMPPPGDAFLAWLREVRSDDPHGLACAIGMRCLLAVQARYAALAQHYQPEELAVHATDALLGQVRSGAAGCRRELAWLAGPFRWRDVVELLRSVPGDAPVAIPEDWRRRGLVVRGDRPADLLRQVAAQSRSTLDEDAVLHGVAPRSDQSVIERAAAELAGPGRDVTAPEAVSFLSGSPLVLVRRLALRSRGADADA